MRFNNPLFFRAFFLTLLLPLIFNVANAQTCNISITTVVDNTVSCFGLSDGQATASATGGTPAYTYAWSNGQNTATATNLATGTYTVIISDANSCIDSSSVTVVVLDNIPPVVTCPADIDTSNDLDQCSAVINYTVSSTDNCSGDTLLQISGLASGSAFPIGTTVNTFVAVDASGNSDTCSFEVVVADTQLPVIICPPSITQCDPLVFFDAPVGFDACAATSTIKTNAFGLFSGSEFPLGTTTIQYRVSDAKGASQTCSFDITVFEPPSVEIGPDIQTTDADPVQLQPILTNYGTGEWSPAFSLDDAFIEDPVASPIETTTYTLNVVSPDGCEASDSVTVFVEVITELVPTTLFTPNGDGRNDTWTLNKPALVNGCKVAVFNRWGNPVFETTGYDNSWDGTENGNPLPEATYYYVIECDGQSEMTGPVTILRVKR